MKLRFFVTALLLMLSPVESMAQWFFQHQPPSHAVSGEDMSFEFRLPASTATQVQEAYIHYRYEGQLAYYQQRAHVGDHVIQAEIPVENTSTALEYFLGFEDIHGTNGSWPDQSGGDTPIRIEILTPGESARLFDSQTGEIKHTILSPDPNARLRPEDFIIALTLFYELETAIPDSFRVQLNDRDITADAEINPWLITYVPAQEPESGSYHIQVFYNSPDGFQVAVADWDFRITSVTETAYPYMAVRRDEQQKQRLISSAQYSATARSQSYSDQTSRLLRNSFRITGRHGMITYNLSGLLTTQEDPRLQPQNRYAAQIHAGNWLMLEAGHVYPMINPYLIAGRRVRGVHGRLDLFSKNMQLQLLYGELSRKISPLYQDITRQERIIGQDSRGEDITENLYLIQSQAGGAGTYEREIIGARIGFGSGRYFGWSFSALRITDLEKSIEVIRSYDDLTFEVFQKMTEIQRLELQDNPDLLELRTADPVPKANVAVASDLQINAHGNRIRFRSDFAASLINENISDGILNRERADELGFDLDEDIETLLDKLSWLIIINENMSVLPLKIRDDKADIFVPQGIFASRNQLNLNYFGHNMAIQYQWIGPDFSTLSNVGQRRDVAGYSISDRFRLLSNTFYVTVGHENNKDNVIGNRDATTKTLTNRINLGWHPVSGNLPRINAGVRHRARGNQLERTNPFLPDILEKSSVRSVTYVADSLVVLPTPRDNVTMQYNTSLTQRFDLLDLYHDATVSLTYLTTKDHAFAFGDFYSRLVSFMLTSSFPVMPVRTTLGFNYSQTEAASGLSKVDVTGFSAGLSWHFMNNRLRWTTDIAITLDDSENTPLTDRLFEGFAGTPNEEIYWRFYVPDVDARTKEKSTSAYLSGSLRYRWHDRHTFLILGHYTRIADRYNVLNIPNNHLLQFRYTLDL